MLVSADGPVPEEKLIAWITERLERFPAWAKTYQSEGGPARLTQEAVGLLCAFGLAERTTEGVRARPAAARYAVRPEPSGGAR
ncbi:Uncharacterized protein LI90_2858 [Carbonactinospora thermoautotrophica]|uniref:Uncharacterized protein n=1 Tax=Carbonactinospora thermoautotrophica TaxID=1469144 RepID=A0A132MVR7_9ACTN|nr:DUF2398 family protein [Carbonactinospora thermoautotrophica]KWX01826.1 Uncharacterized protein LI90_2858 [Carbonactinospora thermoautotrophica]